MINNKKKDIINQAKQELTDEKFREDVEKMKVKLKTKKTLMEKIFPFEITIKRR